MARLTLGITECIIHFYPENYWTIRLDEVRLCSFAKRRIFSRSMWRLHYFVSFCYKIVVKLSRDFTLNKEVLKRGRRTASGIRSYAKVRFLLRSQRCAVLDVPDRMQSVSVFCLEWQVIIHMFISFFCYFWTFSHGDRGVVLLMWFCISLFSNTMFFCKMFGINWVLLGCAEINGNINDWKTMSIWTSNVTVFRQIIFTQQVQFNW